MAPWRQKYCTGSASVKASKWREQNKMEMCQRGWDREREWSSSPPEGRFLIGRTGLGNLTSFIIWKSHPGLNEGVFSSSFSLFLVFTTYNKQKHNSEGWMHLLAAAELQKQEPVCKLWNCEAENADAQCIQAFRRNFWILEEKSEAA